MTDDIKEQSASDVLDRFNSSMATPSGTTDTEIPDSKQPSGDTVIEEQDHSSLDSVDLNDNATLDSNNIDESEFNDNLTVEEEASDDERIAKRKAYRLIFGALSIIVAVAYFSLTGENSEKALILSQQQEILLKQQAQNQDAIILPDDALPEAVPTPPIAKQENKNTDVIDISKELGIVDEEYPTTLTPADADKEVFDSSTEQTLLTPIDSPPPTETPSLRATLANQASSITAIKKTINTNQRLISETNNKLDSVTEKISTIESSVDKLIDKQTNLSGAPKIIVKAFATTSICPDCKPHSVVELNGKQIIISDGDTIAGFKASIHGDRLVLRNKNEQYSYYPAL